MLLWVVEQPQTLKIPAYGLLQSGWTRDPLLGYVTQALVAISQFAITMLGRYGWT